jgi:hypothetical protein
MNTQQETIRIKGGNESQTVVGVALFAVQNGLRGYAITVRVTGTIIAAIQVQDENGQARAYVPTWLGIALYQGDYFVSLSPIVSITLTAATDSITIHCDKPY